MGLRVFLCAVLGCVCVRESVLGLLDECVAVDTEWTGKCWSHLLTLSLQRSGGVIVERQ